MDFLPKKPRESVPTPLEKTNAAKLVELEQLVLEMSEQMTRLNASIARINGQRGGRPPQMQPQSQYAYETATHYITKEGILTPKGNTNGSNK